MTDHPKITLGGIEYFVPKLAIKQNRHVEVLASRNREYFIQAYKSDSQLGILDLTEQQAEDFQKIVYYALTRGVPDLSYAEFEALPLSMREIMVALPVCLMQSGLFKPATEVAPPTGEAMPPSTGMAS